MAHGFDDDAATRRLLRSSPAPAALEWASRAADGNVAGWRVLQGGTSSAMYALALADGRELVLRCYVRKDSEPDGAIREAAALAVAAGTEIPTPRLVAVDGDGARAGVPAVLMSRLPGAVVWDPKTTRRWLSGLAAVLPILHDADPSAADIGRFAVYAQESYEPPRWATRPAVWERAIEIFHGPVLEKARCFIHRDYHPGNVLWRRGRVTGVVDWQSACLGPPSMDISHCRANLLGYAPELADEFTHLATAATGRDFHPWADIASLIGMLDGLRRAPPREAGRLAIEHAIESAVATLGTK